MGSINIDNTGSGGAITLSSDGTNLLLGGSAVGGGADLYAANPSSATDPVASGANAFAIGTNTTASNTSTIAIGADAVASGYQAQAIGNQTDATATNSSAFGNGSQATASNATAIGGATASASYSTAIGKTSINNGAVATSGNAAMALNGYASGAASFAAAIDNNTSTYGATAANSIAIGYLSKATGIGNINIGYEGYATGASGSVALGYRARATGTNAICLGQSGYSTASGAQSLAIGYSANATATHSMAIGRSHTIQAQYATAIGGRNSEATSSAQYGIVTGYEAKIEIYGKSAHASGKFAAIGDAQGGQFILRADTTDATATVLTTNNSAAAATNQIVANSDTCITFDGTITAMQNGAQAYASWRIEGLLVNDGGTTTLANSATTVIQNLSSWGMALSADNTNNALAITCTGEASHNIRWVANIRTTEVTYA